MISTANTSTSHYADLTGSDLSDGGVRGSDIRSANLTDVDFSRVGLAAVSMRFANASKAINADFPKYETDLR